jgi:hypothetical protein
VPHRATPRQHAHRGRTPSTPAVVSTARAPTRLPFAVPRRPGERRSHRPPAWGARHPTLRVERRVPGACRRPVHAHALAGEYPGRRSPFAASEWRRRESTRMVRSVAYASGHRVSDRSSQPGLPPLYDPRLGRSRPGYDSERRAVADGRPASAAEGSPLPVAAGRHGHASRPACGRSPSTRRSPALRADQPIEGSVSAPAVASAVAARSSPRSPVPTRRASERCPPR